jgi:small-conductance mechanosensitive channel
MKSTWIQIEKIRTVLQPEPLILLFVLVASSWILYRVLLKGLSEQRHRNLHLLFRNLALHSALAVVLLGLYFVLGEMLSPDEPLFRVVPNIGLIALISASIVFVKVCRILVFEYLFFFSMRAGVPLLIVNLLSFLLSLVVGVWILSSVFDFHLAPILATSAFFSIVLGLALQDTLGNLIAGVALQLDKPYNIGEWIEVQNGAQKWVGQVREITWRAAILIGIYDELVIIPNRVMAQAQISNYSGRERPFLKSVIFRIPYNHSIEQVRKTIEAAVSGIPGILSFPPPKALFLESTDSGMQFKLVFSPSDYGMQFSLADQVNSRVVAALTREGITVAPQHIKIVQS